MGIVPFQNGQRLFLDANALIYSVEGVEPYADLLRPVFEAATEGRVLLVVSGLTLLETIVGPLKKKDDKGARRFQEVIASSDHIECLPITRSILIQAARLRVSHYLRTPDAIQTATAQLHACDLFITNDATLRNLPDLQAVILSDLLS